jgi:hypothetical protein
MLDKPVDKRGLAAEMANAKTFRQKWDVYVLNSPELAELPQNHLIAMRLAFFAGGIAATQTMLEVQHDMIDEVLEQLKPQK